MKKEVITGGCLCGAIRYEGRGEPYNVTHCQCLDCRKAAGAAFVTWASFGRNEFRFVQGEPRTIEWEGKLRSFCPNCGTALTFMSGPKTNEVDITVASFDEPECVTPKDHNWVSDRIVWDWFVQLAADAREAEESPGRCLSDDGGPRQPR